MQCYKCGYDFSPQEGACPRCKERDTPTGTRRLPDLQSSKTQHLLQIQTCPNCNFVLFPGNKTCPACGVALAANASGVTSQKKSLDSKQIWLYIVSGIAGTVLIILLFFVLKKVL